MELGDTKEWVLRNIDQIYLKLHEIWRCSLQDMLYINEIAGRLQCLRENVSSLKAELQFVSPAGGRFWARNILETGKLSKLRSELVRAKRQVELLKKNKEEGIKRCSDELAHLKGLEDSLGLLEKGLESA